MEARAVRKTGMGADRGDGVKVAVNLKGEKACCLCDEPLHFLIGGGMMPPLIGEYFVCEDCFKENNERQTS